jgi:hypothetical protein
LYIGSTYNVCEGGVIVGVLCLAWKGQWSFLVRNIKRKILLMIRSYNPGSCRMTCILQRFQASLMASFLLNLSVENLRVLRVGREVDNPDSCNLLSVCPAFINNTFNHH